MKMHVLFVEPAQYTLDLLKNVYEETDVTFLNSDSKAVGATGDVLSSTYYCDKHSWLHNLKHFINLGLENQFVISNGYTHWSFILLFLLSFFKKFHIGVESDTPYSEIKGVKKMIKSFYLTTIFSNKSVLGLSGGNGAHMDLFLKYGMERQRVFLMPMMIDNQKYYRSQIKTLNKETVFLYVGRLDPEKNIELLIDAFKTNFKNNGAQLIIVGSGICEDSLKVRSESATNIIFRGKLFDKDLVACYHQSDVLILPSVFEPWGLVVNEALASGLSVLCSNSVGSAADLIIKPNAGWVFESANQEELEKLLLHCVNHPEEIGEKAQNGLRFMKNNWSYKNYKQSLEEVKKYVATH